MNKPIRLFPNTVKGVVNGLQQIFGDGLRADKVVEQLFKDNRKWGKRDRAFIAESIYGIVRYWRKLWALSGEKETTTPLELYKLFGIWWLWQERELPEWEEFKTLKNTNIKSALSALPKDIGIQESYATWFSDLAMAELGTGWSEIAKNLNLPAPVALRINSIKSSKAKALRLLAQEGISYFENEAFPDVVFLEKRTNLKILKSYLSGFYEVQDAGSQDIAKYLKPEPNTLVIDACAGAGGKALHLAALMQNRGKIISLDIFPRKLQEQEKRAKRNGVKIITTEFIEGDENIHRLKGSADRLLLDVPCSGTGVIRREPDSKWKLTKEKLDEVMTLQRELLSKYCTVLKPGGILVYATCSIFKSENQDQVNWFLKEHSEFALEAQKTLNPSALNDGFFMARLRKK